MRHITHPDPTHRCKLGRLAWQTDCIVLFDTVLRAIAHLGLVLLLMASLCLAVAPLKAGGCCDHAGHCQKVSKTCDGHPVAVLNAPLPAIHVAWSVETAVAPQRNSFSPALVHTVHLPPDLCLLHSLLRI
jgi:hypothetical protein